MNLTQIGAGGLFAGLALLSAAVFLLQRLRVRRDEIIVPTTIFWKAALKETQARKLTERFRSPLVFCLLLLIVSLLWLAFAGPRQTAKRDSSYLVLVDTSAGMGRQAGDGASRLDLALKHAEKLLSSIPKAQRALLLLGNYAETLLGPGEPLELLEGRLRKRAAARGVQTSGPPTAIARWLDSLLDARHSPVIPEASMPLSSDAWRPGSEVTVIVLAAPASNVDLESIAARDPNLKLELWPLAASSASNEGILAFGAAPAASGNAQLADLFIETSGPTPKVTWRAPSSAPVPLSLEVGPGGAVSFFVRDVPLSGGTVTASISALRKDSSEAGDALAADDQAELKLPNIGPIRVQITSGINPAWRAALEAVIAADSGLQLVGNSQVAAHDVSILAAADTKPKTSAPRLVITGNAFNPLWALGESGLENGTIGELRATSPPGTPAFQPLFDSLALNQIGTGLRTSNATKELAAAPPNRLVLVEDTRPGARSIELVSALIAAPFELSQTRSFPLLVSSAMRWLAGRTETQLSLGGLTSQDIVGRAITLEATPDVPIRTGRVSRTSGPAELWPALVLFVLALLSLEWYLTQTRRIP